MATNGETEKVEASVERSDKRSVDEAKPWSLPESVTSKYDHACSNELVQYIQHTDVQYREGVGDRAALAREVAANIIKLLKGSGT